MATPELLLRSQIVRNRKRQLAEVRRSSSSQRHRRKMRADITPFKGTSLDGPKARMEIRRGQGMLRSFVNNELRDIFPEY